MIEAQTNVERLLSIIQSSDACVTSQNTREGWQASVNPLREGLCGFAIQISHDGVCAFTFGRGFALAEAGVDELPPDRLTEAVLRGAVSEKAQTFLGVPVSVTGCIATADGEIFSDTRPLFGRRRAMSYRPYTGWE